MNQQAGAFANDPYGELWRAWAAMASGALPRGDATDPFLGSRDVRGPGADGGLMAVLTQAHFASAAAFMRCWNRSAQSWAEYRQAAAGAVAPSAPPSGSDGEALGRLVDEARAHVRRLGEIALDEARLLDVQMQVLSEQLRAVVEDPASSGAPRRRARTKP
jgi:hypothetical protein